MTNKASDTGRAPSCSRSAKIAVVVLSVLLLITAAALGFVAAERCRLADREITMALTDAAKAFIARASYDPAYGARPVKRYLQKNVETELAAMLSRQSTVVGVRLGYDV